MAKIIRDGTTSILREDLGDPDEEIAVGMDVSLAKVQRSRLTSLAKECRVGPQILEL
jgi:hypothetical protein